MWLFFSLLAPFFFAVVHVMDSYCVEDIFEKPWMGMITSALASIIVFAPLPFVLPLMNLDWPPWEMAIIAMIAGALIQISQAMYFQSLAYSEAGIVAAYWNMIPAIIVIFGYVLLNNTLTQFQYIGIIILIIASTNLLLVDQNFAFRRITFFLMITASFMQAISYILLDKIFLHADFITVFLFMTIGLILAGSSPLLFKRIRKQITMNKIHLGIQAKIFVFIEIVNLIALACAEKAIDLYEPALVAAAETTMPAFTFILSILLFYTTKNRIGDERSLQKLPLKITSIALMFCGVILIS